MKKIAFLTVVAAGLALPVWAAGPTFIDVSEKAGVGAAGNGKGVAFADIDNDGYWDIYISNKGGEGHLYRNNGNGTFTDITQEAGVSDAGFKMGSVFFDYDNDGLPDLFLSKGGRDEIEPNRLLKNMGNCKFVDVTEKAGLSGKFFTYSAASADYDNDGYLDLYLANYGVGKKNILYHNNGNGTFTDVTEKAGVGDRSWSWSATWVDVNNDGLLDLYVVNGSYPAGEPNKLYINQGKGIFKEEARDRGVDDPNWGLGATFADYDNDGSLDLYVSNYVGPNNLYHNDGTGHFRLVTDIAGVSGGPDHWGKGPTWGDYDNDGKLDLYEGDCKTANQLYHNNGDGTFTNVAEKNPDVKLATVRTKGTMFADIDNDGDLDLYVVNWAAPNKLFLNTTNNSDYLKVRLVGHTSNHMAIGSRVWVKETGKLIGMRELATASGFCAQAPQELHFGGLKAGKSYTVEVRFPSGARRVLENVTPGKTITIEEPSEVAKR